MPGAISLGFEREPDFFLAAGIEGDRHDTVYRVGSRQRPLVARAPARSGTSSVNGAPARACYLSQLRIDTTYRGRGS